MGTTDPEAASGLTTYNYDAVGNLQNFVYPNGVTHAYSYDALNRLTQVGASKGSTAISSYTYALGAAGNRTSVAELSGRTVAYAYDSLYRLTSETVSADPHNKNGTISYTYDSVGNRKTLSATLPPAGAMNYTYDANDRLAADTYDANGNTIMSGGVADAYDFENHLIMKGGVAVVYDGDGNRVSETVGGVTTNYLVDTVNPTGYAQVVDELVSGTVTRSYGYGLERIDEDQQLNGTWAASFYGYDGHGSVRQLTSSAGTVTDTYDYDAFGNLINSSGNTPNLYLFAGEAYDAALGLYYNRARYYINFTGRFWSADTDEGDDETPLSLNKYLYTNANPVDGTDPFGFQDSMGELGAEESMSVTLDAMPSLNAFGSSSSGNGLAPSTTQLATATTALGNAQILAANALLALETFGGDSKTFKTYFGKTPEPIVEVPFLNTAFALSSYTVNWRIDNGCSSPQTGAHVIFGAGINTSTVTISLCNPRFFADQSTDWPDSRHPHFSRAGMIFHEFTHLVALSNDGPSPGPISGKSKDTIHNAYNLQYFAEDEAVEFK